MLYLIGAIPIQVYPVNVTEVSRKAEATFAEKSVVGARPPLEAVGLGTETMSFPAKLFPHKFGGLPYIDVLNSMLASQEAFPVMRGDGRPMGWFVITEVTEKSSYLDAQGVGRITDIEISLKRSEAPGSTGIFSILEGLF